MYFSIDYGVVSTLVYLGILVLIYKLFLDIDIRYCLFVIVGCIWMLISILGHYNAENMPFVSKEAICRGYVSTESVDKFGLPVYVCEIDEIIFNGMTYNNYKVRLTSKEKQNFSLVGERIEFRAKLDVQEVRDDGIDYRRYLYGKGIDYSSTCRRIKILRDRGFKLSKVRFDIIKAINTKKNLFLSRISPSSRGYFSGIIFGEKNLISSDVIEEFQDTGTAHILAVSGLHIGIIYMIFKKLTTRFNLGNRVDFVLILMLGIYIVLASFSISIVRAVLIILLKIIADNGIVLDKFASLATDSFRSLSLELCGYKTKMIEFIDMEHTPKNILIKAIKSKSSNLKEKLVEYNKLKEFLGIKPLLEDLIKKYFLIDTNTEIPYN